MNVLALIAHLVGSAGVWVFAVSGWLGFTRAGVFSEVTSATSVLGI